MPAVVKVATHHGITAGGGMRSGQGQKALLRKRIQRISVILACFLVRAQPGPCPGALFFAPGPKVFSYAPE